MSSEPGPEAWIARAAALGASDLAWDPQDDGALAVVARVAGLRERLGSVPASAAAAAIARLKALARLPAYVTAEAQDGRLDGAPFGVPGDVRVAVLPTVRGQRLALRLPAVGPLPAPDALGLPGPALAALRRLMARPAGLLVVTGPTGSGKTTTIHSLVAELAATRADRQVVTIEDPVERRLAGVVQVEAARTLGFEAALAAALRQDVDVLVVGEVRDGATARACLRAALTGHLVLTTVHAGRAAEVVPRLVEMGCEAELLLPALAGVLAQRLVRLVHPACGGAGCPGCRAGFRERRLVADLLLVDAAARAALGRGELPPLAEDLERQAAALAAAGLTTTAEVARAIGG